jgi:O-antigen/teichoic acid export membrane protein
VLSLAAEPIIGLLFGAQYRAAAPVLAVQAWCGFFMVLGITSGAWLMAHRRGVLNLRRNALGMGVNLLLNLWLIPRHGALGAAWATLAAFATAYLLYDFMDPAMRDVGRDKLRALAWR